MHSPHSVGVLTRGVRRPIGNEGVFRVIAQTDPEIVAAVVEVIRAGVLLGD